MLLVDLISYFLAIIGSDLNSLFGEFGFEHVRIGFGFGLFLSTQEVKSVEIKELEVFMQLWQLLVPHNEVVIFVEVADALWVLV